MQLSCVLQSASATFSNRRRAGVYICPKCTLIRNNTGRTHAAGLRVTKRKTQALPHLIAAKHRVFAPCAHVNIMKQEGGACS
jgi:hypothetical protein